MSFSIVLPPEVIERLVAEVTAQVLSELQAAAEQPTRSPYMTIPEAATFLRCQRHRIDDLLSQRRLTRVKEGSRTLLLRTEIERHLRTTSEQRAADG